MAKEMGETRACKLDRPIGAQNREQLLDTVKQCGKLLQANSVASSERGTLGHLATARDTGPRKNAPRARVRPASSIWIRFLLMTTFRASKISVFLIIQKQNSRVCNHLQKRREIMTVPLYRTAAQNRLLLL